TKLYFSLLTGALTLSLVCFLPLAALWGLVRLAMAVYRWRPFLASLRSITATGILRWLAVVLFGLCGAAGAAVLHPGKIDHGIAHSACFPTVILVVALAWGILSRADPVFALPFVVGMLAEFLLMFWSHVWLAVHMPQTLDLALSNP